MSTEIQEWLALICVIAVAATALWQWRTNKKARGCNGCGASQCRPNSGDKSPVAGANADPYRPHLFRPMD